MFKDFFNSIKFRCYHYSAPLEYPHGKMKSISIVDYREGGRHDWIICLISFTDGYMGSYSFDADKYAYDMFLKLKPYK